MSKITDKHAQIVSVVVPCFNNAEIVKEMVELILCQDQVNEVIIVDDNSTDGTIDVLKIIEQEQHPRISIYYNAQHTGKGKTLTRGFQKATGDIIIIQELDWDYDPREYSLMLTPITLVNAQAVYGSRFLGSQRIAISFFRMLTDKSLKLITKHLYGSILTDMDTSFRSFLQEIIEDISLKESGFKSDYELIAKILKQKSSIYEVPIHYRAREYVPIKTIKWQDVPIVIWTLLKYRFVD